MTALILLSHGSLLCGSAETVRGHAAAIASTGEFGRVEVAFMNYSQPSLRQAVATCLGAGARQIVVTPYLLVPGKFMLEEVPAQLSQVRGEHPFADFLVADAIGFDNELVDAVIELACGAKTVRDWGRIAERTAGNCAQSRRCPFFEPTSCSAMQISQRLGEPLQHMDAGNDLTCDSVSNSRGLVMVAHGSPREEANLPILQVADEVRTRRLFHSVDVAYLECNEPTISKGIISASSNGSKQIVVVPYFLHAGKHVARDIPRELREVSSECSSEIYMADYLGESTRVANVIRRRAVESIHQAVKIDSN